MELLDTYDGPECLRCGYCCQKVTCMWGAIHGAVEGHQCKFLLGEKPGFYSCQLVSDGVVPPHSLAIGAGCSSALFNDQRWEAAENRRKT